MLETDELMNRGTQPRQMRFPRSCRASQAAVICGDRTTH